MIHKNENGSTVVVFGDGTLRSGTYKNEHGEPEGIVISDLNTNMENTIFIPLKESRQMVGLFLSLERFARDTAETDEDKKRHQSKINLYKKVLDFDTDERIAKKSDEDKYYTFSENTYGRIMEFVNEQGSSTFKIESGYSLKNDIVLQCKLTSGKDFRLVIRYYETSEEYVEISQ